MNEINACVTIKIFFIEIEIYVILIKYLFSDTIFFFFLKKKKIINVCCMHEVIKLYPKCNAGVWFYFYIRFWEIYNEFIQFTFQVVNCTKSLVLYLISSEICHEKYSRQVVFRLVNCFKFNPTRKQKNNIKLSLSKYEVILHTYLFW